MKNRVLFRRRFVHSDDASPRPGESLQSAPSIAADVPLKRRILAQRKVRAGAHIVIEVRFQDAPQTSLIQDDPSVPDESSRSIAQRRRSAREIVVP